MQRNPIKKDSNSTYIRSGRLSESAPLGCVMAGRSTNQGSMAAGSRDISSWRFSCWEGSARKTGQVEVLGDTRPYSAPNVLKL